jgi:uncharacterized protein (TIGR02145 family)
MEKKISFKNLSCLLWMLLFMPAVMLGQVNVGSPKAPNPYAVLELSTSVVKGGVRMPQLTSEERDAISTVAFMSDAAGTGLTIYNVTTNCIEYWNKIKWVSLCQGQLDISFNPQLDPNLPKDGGTNGPYTPVDKYPCTGQTPYSFTVVTGGDYTSVDVVNTDSGTFSVIMQPNITAKPRMAIVRVTNNCTGESKEFLFSQEGNADLCGSAGTPSVSVSGGGVLCTGGAVYMQITNASDTADYIWTINEIEQGRGAAFTALRAGVYKVYVGAIGCTNASAPITVTNSTTNAPRNPITLSASNNGVVCGNSTVTLTAFNVPSEGTIAWYNNGERTSKTGNPISISATETGNWFAVLEQGSCSSTPSSIVMIKADNTSTPLAKPEVYVNGKSLSSITSFCSNGAAELVLNNYSSYTTGVTVRWYNGLTFLGEGERLNIVTPSGGDFLLRCVVSDNIGAFCSSELFENKSLTEVSPAQPVIVSSPSSVCGGTSAKLTATVSGSNTGYTFNWYKDGKILAGKNSQTLETEEIGTYTVEVVAAGGCVSSLSIPTVIGLSDFPTVTWKSTSDAAELGQIKIFQVESTFAPTVYNWTVDGDAQIQNGQGSNTVSIKFPAVSKTVTIKVTAVNDCGKSDELQQIVNVSAACTPVVVRNSNMNPSSGTIMVGGSVSMSVTANGTNPITYKWFKDETVISGATSSTYTISNAQVNNSGVYKCEVSNGCTSPAVTQVLGTVSVIDISSIADGSTAGTGQLGGSTCLDVAFTEGPECGTLASRVPLKADLTQTFVYTFTSIGAGNKNLKFIINDPQAAVVSSSVQEGIPAALLNGGKYIFTVKYKESLMTSGIPTPIPVDIIAVYTNANGQQNKVALAVTIKDCQCCGAYVAPGVWKNFMCHNLGADYTLDPLKPVQAIFGNYYQWGRSTVIADSYTSPSTKINMNTGSVTSTAWNDAAKTAADPCPAGYRVPTSEQWKGVANQTLNPVKGIGTFTESSTNFSSGGLVGNSLFLPFNGIRRASDGTANLTGYIRGARGFYWSSTGTANSTMIMRVSYPVTIKQITFTVNDVFTVMGSEGNRNVGLSVRCVQE